MARGKTGRLIVLDGPDGAGKSTQVRLLKEALEARRVKVLALREPGGTAAGEAIRKLVLEQREIGLSPLTETFLFQAARAQLIEEVVKPALKKGTWVVCDRFFLSTLVYQGYAGGVDKGVVETLSKVACAGVVPDVYLVVWVKPSMGIQRRAARAADRMEAKGIQFIKDVASAFRRETLKRPRQFRFVDGAGTPEAVQARIWAQVEPLLK
jgi:dTMP kinase